MHYVIADPHGEYDRYQRLLDLIGFSDADILYILGDVVDRGGIGGVDILQDVMDRSNVVMLLGNHEAMCLKAIDQPDNERAVNHWMRNGGQVTHDALCRLTPEMRAQALDFLRTLPDHLDLEIEGKRFHLVHGFPAGNTYDRLWLRPGPNAVSPFPDGRTVIAGHTPVCELWGDDDKAREKYLRRLGDGHLRIFCGPGYFDLDCACGYELPQRRLACFRLEDLAEFYT